MGQVVLVMKFGGNRLGHVEAISLGQCCQKKKKKKKKETSKIQYPAGYSGRVIDIDTTEFNHIAFEYVRNKLTLWVNGKSRKSHNVDLGELSDIRIDVQQLGVLSLYNRELSKTEVAEHFVEYQVNNFSNDEVLI